MGGGKIPLCICSHGFYVFLDLWRRGGARGRIPREASHCVSTQSPNLQQPKNCDESSMLFLVVSVLEVGMCWVFQQERYPPSVAPPIATRTFNAAIQEQTTSSSFLPGLTHPHIYIMPSLCFSVLCCVFNTTLSTRASPQNQKQPLPHRPQTKERRVFIGTCTQHTHNNKDATGMVTRRPPPCNPSLKSGETGRAHCQPTDRFPFPSNTPAPHCIPRTNQPVPFPSLIFL